MMEQLIRDGALEEALSATKAEIREQPAASKPRLFLFQLLCILQRWEEALNQLEVLGELDAEYLLLKQIFRAVITAELHRGKVLRGEARPVLPQGAPPWLDKLLLALGEFAQGDAARGEELRQAAFDEVETTVGSLNGAEFSWLADADTRFGPIVEYITRDQYCWAPFSAVASIHCEPPQDLRDLVWFPAQFSQPDGGRFAGFLPVRYPMSAETTDASSLLSRRTEWQPKAGDSCHGLGLRIWATDEGEVPLLEVRELILHPTPAGSLTAP